MRIFKPSEVEPAIKEFGSLKVIHRRMVTPAAGGPAGLDLGYNRYHGRGDYEGPYAYNKDEFCFTSQGRMEGTSLGSPHASVPGSFMWRPAGAVTDGFRITEDVVNVCVFAPARIDASSHRLGPSEFPIWDGRPETRFIPKRVQLDEVAPTPMPGASTQEGLVFRRIFSRTADGSNLAEVGHLTMIEGATMDSYSSPADELWWLETGRISLDDSSSQPCIVEAHDCVFKNAGESLRQIKALEPSVLVCFAAGMS